MILRLSGFPFHGLAEAPLAALATPLGCPFASAIFDVNFQCWTQTGIKNTKFIQKFWSGNSWKFRCWAQAGNKRIKFIQKFRSKKSWKPSLNWAGTPTPVWSSGKGFSTEIIPRARQMMAMWESLVTLQYPEKPVVFTPRKATSSDTKVRPSV